MRYQLCQALDELRLSNNGRDLQARKANLTALVNEAHLSTDEIRLVKDLLSTVTFQKDIVGNLPIELVVSMTDYLDVKDILACLAVSKQWYATFTNDRVIFQLARRLFPSLLWEKSKAGNQYTDSQAGPLSSFLQAVRKRARWLTASARATMIEKRYRWDDEAYFSLDGQQQYSQFVSPSPRFFPVRRYRSVYAHGRIAWQPELHTIVVDSFHTRVRKILSAPGSRLLGAMLQLEALGDRLVVANVERHLFAWDFSTARFEKTILPNRPDQCATSGIRVAILANHELYIWQFGSDLLHIEMPHPNLSPGVLPHGQCSSIIVHPWLESTLFISFVHNRTISGSYVTLYKFNQRKLESARVIDIPGVEAPQWMMRRSDSYGHYSLCCLQRSAGDKKYRYRTIQLDVYHETISTIDFHTINGMNDTEQEIVAVDDDYAVIFRKECYGVVALNEQLNQPQ
ncbi:hypothetical protein BJ170DRAFT_32056 [Xylariales sp. AK1849]|nr:hypothetical protein BJ170DRAFT_32056 [Xylariales sp. AK1849]